MPSTLSQNAEALIFRFEGLDEPHAWPGGDSGVSIGIGYDLGYVTHAEFAKDWSPTLAPADFARLDATVGLTGEAAHAAAKSLAGIFVSRIQARAIFRVYEVPQYSNLTRTVFLGGDQLPPDAFGALFSLVFNRGADMVGDRRREMRSIRRDVQEYADANSERRTQLLWNIGWQLRSMKRLWGPTNSPGLIPRREAEAVLVEGCIPKLL